MFSRRSKRPTISMRAARGMLSDDISLDVSSNESRSVSDFSSPTFSSSSASLNSGSEYTASPPAPVVDSTPHQRQQQQQQQEEVSVTPIRTASSTIPSQLSPQMELRLNLLPRIGQFRSRGWITSEEEHNLTNILSHTKYDDKFEADEAAVMVKRKLNQIQRREIERLETEAASNEMFEDSPENKGDNNNNNNRESTDEQTADRQPPSILGNCRKGLSVSFDGTQSNKNQSTPQEPISKSLFSAAMQKKITKSPLKFDSKKFGRDEANKENSVNETFEQEQSSSTLDDIYTPHEATQIRGIDQTSMEDLFVEMSFFARLGFLQPPSCLKCAHHQTVGQKQQGNTTGTGISKPCNRLVAWRKDANVLLHPDKLEGNLLVVSCANATKLHKGETVSNYVWDRKQRLFTGP